MTDPAPVRHLAQDLRAEAHRVPDDVAALMRQAAAVCDDHAAYMAELTALEPVRPVPFPPPPLHGVKGAPCF